MKLELQQGFEIGPSGSLLGVLQYTHSFLSDIKYSRLDCLNIHASKPAMVYTRDLHMQKYYLHSSNLSIPFLLFFKKRFMHMGDLLAYKRP